MGINVKPLIFTLVLLLACACVFSQNEPVFKVVPRLDQSKVEFNGVFLPNQQEFDISIKQVLPPSDGDDEDEPVKLQFSNCQLATNGVVDFDLCNYSSNVMDSNGLLDIHCSATTGEEEVTLSLDFTFTCDIANDSPKPSITQFQLVYGDSPAYYAPLTLQGVVVEQINSENTTNDPYKVRLTLCSHLAQTLSFELYASLDPTSQQPSIHHLDALVIGYTVTPSDEALDNSIKITSDHPYVFTMNIQPNIMYTVTIEYYIRLTRFVSQQDTHFHSWRVHPLQPYDWQIMIQTALRKHQIITSSRLILSQEDRVVSYIDEIAEWFELDLFQTSTNGSSDHLVIPYDYISIELPHFYGLTGVSCALHLLHGGGPAESRTFKCSPPTHPDQPRICVAELYPASSAPSDLLRDNFAQNVSDMQPQVKCYLQVLSTPKDDDDNDSNTSGVFIRQAITPSAVLNPTVRMYHKLPEERRMIHQTYSVKSHIALFSAFAMTNPQEPPIIKLIAVDPVRPLKDAKVTISGLRLLEPQASISSLSSSSSSLPHSAAISMGGIPSTNQGEMHMSTMQQQETALPLDIIGCYLRSPYSINKAILLDSVELVNRGQDTITYTLILPESLDVVDGAPVPFLDIECAVMKTTMDPLTMQFQVSIEPPASPAFQYFVPSISIPSITFTNTRNISGISMSFTSPKYVPIQTIALGGLFQFHSEVTFPTGYPLFNGDHIVLYHHIFRIIHHMSCVIDVHQMLPRQQCIFFPGSTGSSAESEENGDGTTILGPHVKCYHTEPLEDNSFPGLPEPTLLTDILKLDIYCKGVVVEDAPSDDAFQFNTPQGIYLRVFPDQSQKAPHLRYQDSPYELLPAAPPQLHVGLSVKSPLFWSCHRYYHYINTPDQNFRMITPVPCEAVEVCPILPQDDPFSPPRPMTCGVFCTTVALCFSSDFHLDAQDCYDEGLVYPLSIGKSYVECECEEGTYTYGPNCDIPPHFSSPIVSHINGDGMASYVRRSYSSGKVDEIPTKDAVYSIALFYQDTIALTWSYSGNPTANIVITMSSSELGAHGLVVATTNASKGEFTFRFEDVLAPLGVSFGLTNIRFQLRMGPYTMDESYRDDQLREVYMTELSLQPRCTMRDTSSNDSTSRCLGTSSQCDADQGICHCEEGLYGRFCQRDSDTGGDDDDDAGYEDPIDIVCRALQCVTENTYAGHSHGEECIPVDNDDDAAEEVLKCNCLPEYTGEYCEHERICEHHGCTYGRLVSPTGEPEACECECNNTFITGSTCNQCGLPCRNGGVVNGRCTQCQCKAGYIGDVCQIPVWYHSFTLRNLPQHIVKMILDVSSSSSSSSSSQAQLLAILRDTMVKLLLDDYSRALRDTFIIVDDANGEGGGDGEDGNDSRIRVRVELSQFQTVVPPANPNAPYVYIQLMLYPADMTDEMLAYAQQHGLVFDWSRITNNLDFFKQFLREQGIIDENGDDGIVPEIDDPGCTTRKCRDGDDDDDDNQEDPSSNGVYSPYYSSLLYITSLLVFLQLFVSM